MSGSLPATLPRLQEVAFIPTRAARDLPDGALRVLLALVMAGAEHAYIRAPATAIARTLGYRAGPRGRTNEAAPLAVRRHLLALEAKGYATRRTFGVRGVLWRVHSLPVPREERTHA